MISHDLKEIYNTCDKIAVMRKGKMIEFGKKDEIILNPIHPYTMELLIDYLRFYWCDKNKVEHESEIAYKGYTMLRSFLWESIFTIANTFDNVMFISHEQEVIEKNKFGREISKFQPVFEEKLRDQMSGLMGIIARTVKSISEDGTARYELHIVSESGEDLAKPVIITDCKDKSGPKKITLEDFQKRMLDIQDHMLDGNRNKKKTFVTDDFRVVLVNKNKEIDGDYEVYDVQDVKGMIYTYNKWKDARVVSLEYDSKGYVKLANIEAVY